MNRIRCSSGLFLLLSLVFFQSCIRDQNLWDYIQSTSVEGFVVDQAGNRLKGAIVWIEKSENYALADEDGRYKLTHQESGEVTVLASAPLYLQKKATITLSKESVNRDLNFILEEQPDLIRNIIVRQEGNRQVRVSWETVFAGDGQVEFGPSLGYGQLTTRELEPATSHAFLLPNLSALTTYYFRVRSHDASGFLHSRAGESFIPREFLEDPGKPEPLAVTRIFPRPRQGEARLEWVANPFNVDVIGYEIYRAENRAGPFKKINANLVPPDFFHFLDQNLEVMKKYYYYVTIRDGEGFESDPGEILEFVAPGNLISSRQWTKVESPYLVRGDLRILAEGELRVEPGVRILLAADERNTEIDGARVEIFVLGKMTLAGTASEPIMISGEYGLPDEWGGLTFERGARESLFEHVQIGGSKEASAELKTDQVTFSNCIFSHSRKGLLLRGLDRVRLQGLRFEEIDEAVAVHDGDDIRLTGNQFTDCARSIDIERVSSTTLNLNEIRGSTEWGIRINNPLGATVIRNNLIEGGAGLGIDLLTASATVRHNTLHQSGTGLKLGQGTLNARNNLVVSFPTTGASGVVRELGSATARFNSVVNFTNRYLNLTGANDPNLPVAAFVGGTPHDYHLLPTDPHQTAGENGAQIGCYGGL